MTKTDTLTGHRLVPRPHWTQDRDRQEGDQQISPRGDQENHPPTPRRALQNVREGHQLRRGTLGGIKKACVGASEFWAKCVGA